VRADFDVTQGQLDKSFLLFAEILAQKRKQQPLVNFASSEQYDKTFKPQRDNRNEHTILADPFEFRPFENQVKCGQCEKSLSVKLMVQDIRSELQKASNNNSKVLERCECNSRFPNCAVCLKSVTILNPMSEFRNIHKQQQ
jgi:hypothetical protein